MKNVPNWYSVKVQTAHIAPTPTNYKIQNALGFARFKKSLELFGKAGTMICNWSKNVGDIKHLVLIDGNSRHKDAIANNEKSVWVSVPDRKLTPKEFQEMGAMFDASNASEVDYERIQGDIGKTKDFYERWNLVVPKQLLDKLGAKQLSNYKAEKADKKSNSKALKVTDDKNLNDIVMVQLLFTQPQSEEFRELETIISAKLKTKGTMDTVLYAFKKLIKLLK